ncbi:uncharacterized protein BJX67DRAFT_382027 [Aspergillus lucknowensis]|uniref:Uncharacterized protein n=1 Tax=Aspergillus lucknowensis TaxID=176173 RepID=A0ABR4LNV5_9EURO
MLRRWKAYFAAKEEEQRAEELVKKREGVRKRRAEKYQQAIDEVRRQNTHIERIGEKLEKADAERSTHGKGTAKKIDRLTAEMGKVEMEKQKSVKGMLRRADAELEKLEQKEAEDTMKIKWLVISEAGKEKGMASKE